MEVNVRKLARTDASEKIVNLILETLDNLPAAERVLSPPKKLSTYRKIYAAWRKLKRRKIFFERKTADLKNRKSDVIAGKSVMNIEAE